MAERPELPRWGRRARSTFRACSVPVGLSIGVNALHALGVVPALGSRPVAAVLLVAITAVVVGCVVSGLVWLAAEVAAGFGEPS